MRLRENGRTPLADRQSVGRRTADPQFGDRSCDGCWFPKCVMVREEEEEEEGEPVKAHHRKRNEAAAANTCSSHAEMSSILLGQLFQPLCQLSQSPSSPFSSKFRAPWLGLVEDSSTNPNQRAWNMAGKVCHLLQAVGWKNWNSRAWAVE